MKILVVEDEGKVAGALRTGLEAEGHQAVVACTGAEGCELVRGGVFDLLLLDLMLPDKSGWEILEDLREQDWHTPVLILSALDRVDERVKGLDMGADDYLTKPFAMSELLARVRALCRRGQAQVPVLTIADLELNVTSRKVVRGGAVLDLTPKEFEMLEYLLRNKGHTVSRRMLARHVWQETGTSLALDNLIDVQIHRLRHKVDGPFGVPIIRTVRGVGFKVDDKV